MDGKQRNNRKTSFLVILAAFFFFASLLISGSALARSVMEPVNPTPADGATGVSTNVTLYWELAAVVANPQSYDVYLGTDPDPTYFGSTGDVEYTGPGDLFMDVGELEKGETYYWRVVAHYYGDDLTSATWSFKTEGSSSGCSAGILTPFFLLLLVPMGLLLKKCR
ncbi:MAG: Synerg-CTERM sorting domain-containing protein [Synergistales bacterium]